MRVDGFQEILRFHDYLNDKILLIYCSFYCSNDCQHLMLGNCHSLLVLSKKISECFVSCV